MDFLEQYIKVNKKKHFMLIMTNIIFFCFYSENISFIFKMLFIFMPTVLMSLIIVSIINNSNKKKLLANFSESKSLSNEEIKSIYREYVKSYFISILIILLVIVTRIFLSKDLLYNAASQSQGFAIAALLLLITIVNDCFSCFVYFLITIPRKNSKFMRNVQALKKK